MKSGSIGPSFPVLNEVLRAHWGGGGSYSESPNGTMVYVRGSLLRRSDLGWYNRDGTLIEQLAIGTNSEWGLDLNKTGTRALTGIPNYRNDDIYIIDNGGTTQVTSHPSSEGWSIWSPDGNSIAYQRDFESGGNLVLIQSLESGAQPKEIYRSDYPAYPRSWTPDGNWILIAEGSDESNLNILAINVTDPQNILRIAETPNREWDPQISPDGNWLAYDYEEGSKTVTNITSFPDPGVRTRLIDGSYNVRWTQSTNEIFYWWNNVLMVSAYETVPRFSVISTDSLFSIQDDTQDWWKEYDVSPDGQRILLKTQNESEKIKEVQVVLNFFELLRDSN